VATRGSELKMTMVMVTSLVQVITAPRSRCNERDRGKAYALLSCTSHEVLVRRQAVKIYKEIKR